MMSDETPKRTADELTPALRKALVELGALIPTTPEEVELVEDEEEDQVTPKETEAAFAALERILADDSPADLMKLDDCVVPVANEGLAMAARHGAELDDETLKKINESIAQASRKKTDRD